MSAATKVAPEVLMETADGKSASVVIFLANQADVSAAHGMKDQDARGWFVYNTLTQHAARTQADLKTFLTTQGVSYQSFWVANMIIATVNRSLVDSLAARADVARIDSNRPARWIEDPEVANFEVTPNKPDVTTTVEWGVTNVNAPSVWAMGFTGQGMVIGDLDTGQRWTHNALKPKYRGWNGVTADHNYNWHDAIHTGGGSCGPNTPAPCDDFGHGTHTAGTTVGDDGIGNQVGVAPGAQWIGCRNMDQGNGTPATYTECFQFMIAPTDLAGNNANPALRPHILNNSWGCPASEGCVTRAELETIINNTQAAGIFVEASAGNSGPSCSSVSDPPSIYSASFSTGAISISNTLASFSSRGPSTFYTPNLLKPNISAPGVNVRSTTSTTDNSFASMSGTSMAGPHVCGVIALLWSARPQLVRNIDATKTVLQNTANPGVTVAAQTCGGTPSTQIPNNSFGYGRVDALAAVNSVGTSTPTPSPTSTATATATPTTTATATGTVPPTATATPSPMPSCPAVITQSSSQAITTGNSVSCNNGAAHMDNSYWRAFTVGTSFGGSYIIDSVSFGVESANNTQPVTVRLYRNTGVAFPGGTRELIGTTTITVTPAQAGTVVTTPFSAALPAGISELVMELFTPDGQTAGNLFFVGSNASPESGPSYLSATACGITTPTTTAALGFPNMHIVFNVQGFCEGTPPPPSPTATAATTVTPTATASVTATATVAGTPTPSVSPSTTPTPGPAHPINISTRMRVLTNANVGIGGFIITGTAPKTVLLRGIGPSLINFGVPDPLADPVLELHGPAGFATIINDNWRDTQGAAIKATGIAPTNDLESAILVTLDPGPYTAIVKGNNNGTGVGLVEAYDLGEFVDSKLANISTRAFVGTGTDIMIAGFILGRNTGDDLVILRGIGPSLGGLGVPNPLANPKLEFRDSSGALITMNDNCGDDPVQAGIVAAAGLSPTDPLEACIAATVPPGIYTALLSGVNNGTGVGLVEAYDLGSGGPVPTPTTTPAVSPSPSPATCVENFDDAIPPTFPPGWVTSNPDPGDGNGWVVSNVMPFSPPNDAFCPDQDGISDKVLDRMGITIMNASAVMSFRNKFDTEFSDGTYWDGYVLEVSSPNISGGDFLDITDSHVGGSFVSGGYTGEISGLANNPLAGRMAWSGNSGGYILTVINLGPNLAGQTVTLRFRMGTDEAVAAKGVRIDDISITNASCP